MVKQVLELWSPVWLRTSGFGFRLVGGNWLARVKKGCVEGQMNARATDTTQSPRDALSG